MCERKTSPDALTRSSSRSFSSSVPSRRKQTSENVARGDDLPAGLVLDPAFEQLGKADVLANPLLQALAAEAAQNRPELQRAEAAAERLVTRSGSTASSGDCRYSGTRLNAPPKVVWAGGSRAAEQSVGIAEPLVRVDDDRVGALPAGEVVRSSGQIAAAPAYAASTWSQTPSAPAAIRNAQERVHRARARRPDRRDERTCTFQVDASGRIRKLSSTGTFRSSSSSSFAALSTDECACSEQTTARRPGRSARAAASADERPVDAVSSMWPWRPPTAGRAAVRASRASPPRAPGARATYARGSRPGSGPRTSSSARIPGSCSGRREVREEARALPVRQARSEHGSRSSRIAEKGSGASGGDAGNAARISPGSTCDSTGSSRTRSR